MFVATLGELEMCQGKNYTLVNGHTAHNVKIDQLLRVLSKDQGLVATLVEINDGRCILGDHIVESRFEFAQDIDQNIVFELMNKIQDRGLEPER